MLSSFIRLKSNLVCRRSYPGKRYLTLSKLAYYPGMIIVRNICDNISTQLNKIY